MVVNLFNHFCTACEFLKVHDPDYRYMMFINNFVHNLKFLVYY